MTALSHRAARMSMHALAAATVLLAASPAMSAGPAATSPYYGRWTVTEENPRFSSKGMVYKTIDVAACGNDFCGVSVNDAGKCGATLFRFLSKHADGETTLRGHGRWGSQRKRVQIDTWNDPDTGGRQYELYLGDSYDFGERSDNMPKFHTTYRQSGQALCRAR